MLIVRMFENASVTAIIVTFLNQISQAGSLSDISFFILLNYSPFCPPLTLSHSLSDSTQGSSGKTESWVSTSCGVQRTHKPAGHKGGMTPRALAVVRPLCPHSLCTSCFREGPCRRSKDKKVKRKLHTSTHCRFFFLSSNIIVVGPFVPLSLGYIRADVPMPVHGGYSPGVAMADSFSSSGQVECLF